MNLDLIDDFDHLDPSLTEDLFGVYAQLRARCPVAHGSRFGGFYVLSRYEDVRRAALDHRSFASGQGITIPHMGNSVPGFAESDEPRHRAYREAVLPFFTQKAIGSYTSEITAIVDDAIDAFIETGRADLVRDYAELIPPRAVAPLIGLDREDIPLFARWTREMFDKGAAGDLDGQAQAAGELFSHLEQIFAKRRTDPRDDIFTALLQAQPKDGIPLSAQECLGNLFAIVIGGHDTTIHGIGQLLYHLALHPQHRARLAEDDSLLDLMIEETLRLEAPIQQFARTTTTEVCIHGETIPAGSRVMLLFGSANRDENQFTEPDTFVPDREPNAHLAFGHGVHRCLGVHFARLELHIAAQRILDRLPDYELDGDVIRTGLQGGITWGLASLPVRFSPGKTTR